MRFYILLLSLCVSLPAAAQDVAPPQAKTLVAVTSPQSQERLERSRHKADLFALANQYESQMNAGTCGPASAVIVLNALRPDPDDARVPIDESAFPSEARGRLPKGMQPVPRRYTQRAFFDDTFEKVKPIERFYGKPDDKGARDPGIQLRQLRDILAHHGLDATIRVVSDDLDEKTVKKELIANLERSGDFVIVNYDRRVLGQPGGGHISPVGAYDEKSDSFLILDTNPSRAPWVWVPASLLVKAMRTKDTVENRGYILLAEKPAKSKSKPKGKAKPKAKAKG